MNKLLDFFPDDKILVKICNNCGKHFDADLTECPKCNTSNYYEDEVYL